MTGAQGLLGSSVALRLLADGHDVAVVDSPNYGARRTLLVENAAGARVHSEDVTSPAMRALLDDERPDVVVHLIERADPKRALDDPLGDAFANLIAAINVLEACRYAGTARFVATTSALRLYGRNAVLPAREADGFAPDSMCGVARRSLIDYLRIYHDQMGIDWVVLALGSMYGPGQRPLGEEAYVATFLQQMLAGEPPAIHGDGTQTRDFVYIGDVTYAIALAIEHGSRTVLNIGTGVETSLIRLYDECRRATGFIEPPHFALERTEEAHRFVLDPARAAIELGWRYSTALDLGIDLTVAAMRPAAHVQGTPAASVSLDPAPLAER